MVEQEIIVAAYNEEAKDLKSNIVNTTKRLGKKIRNSPELEYYEKELQKLKDKYGITIQGDGTVIFEK